MNPDPNSSAPPPRSNAAAPEEDAEVLAQVLTLKEDREPQIPLEETERAGLVRYDPVRHYLLEISKYQPLTRGEEQHLARLYRDSQDKEAARRLVTSNLKLVVKIAFLYNKVYANLMDIIQEGNLGLLQAVRKFDPDRGTRLSTYASWWIKAYIIKFILENFRIVRVGTTNDRRKLLMNLRQEKQRLEAQGIAPTPKLIAHNMNVSEGDVIDVENSIRAHDLSLDATTSSDSDLYYLETLASTEDLIDEKLAAGELKDLIESKFAQFAEGLGERDRVILQQRLIAEEPLTLQAIADRYGVTREAIRVSEKKLVGKVKNYMKEALQGVPGSGFQAGGGLAAYTWEIIITIMDPVPTLCRGFGESGVAVATARRPGSCPPTASAFAWRLGFCDSPSRGSRQDKGGARSRAGGGGEGTGEMARQVIKTGQKPGGV